MTGLFSVFADQRFDHIFSQTASLQGAKDEVEFDVISLHANARAAISAAVDATQAGNPDTSARIALILGGAGFGKTHLLATSLRRLALDGGLYPAVLQMTAPVTDDNYEQWMLEAVIRELNNPYFAIPRLNDNVRALLRVLPAEDDVAFRQAVQNEDRGRCEALADSFAPLIAQARARSGAAPFLSPQDISDRLMEAALVAERNVPLMDLAKMLVGLLDGPEAESFRLSADAGEDDCLALIPQLARDLRKKIERRTHSAVSEDFLKALLLYFGGDLTGFDALCGQEADAGLPGLAFRPLATPEQRRRRLGDISVAARAVDGAFVIAFDQLESFWSLANEALYVRAIEKAVNLVQEFSNICIVLASLQAVYDELHDKLIESVRDRIQMSLPPTHLLPPNRDQLRALFHRRMGVIAEMASAGDADALMAFVPEWLINELAAARIRMREAVAEFARFRALARDLGRLPEESEFFVDVPAPPTSAHRETDREAEMAGVDYAKAWQDQLDSFSAKDAPDSDEERIELLRWAGEAVAQETASISLRADVTRLPDHDNTPALRVVITPHDEPEEVRLVGLCGAPNREYRLARQIQSVHRHAGEARPVVVGRQRLPRGRGAQVSRPLDAVRAQGGLVADLQPVDWQVLSAARAFASRHEGNPDFAHWRRVSAFLLNRVTPLRGIFLPQPHIAAVPVARTGATAGTNGHAHSETANGSLTAVADEAARLEPDAQIVAQDAPAPQQEQTPVIADDDDDDRFRVYLGQANAAGKVYWDPYRSDVRMLNFGFLVTGDPGSGKTQTLRVVIDAMARQGFPVCILDFKNDYSEPAFAKPLGLSIYNVRRGGLPFNPLQPVPEADGRVQPICHIHTVGEVIQRVFRLGTQQQAKLKNALKVSFEARGLNLQGWYREDEISAPGFGEVVEILREHKESESLLNRVDPLFDLGIFPSDDSARLSFPDLLNDRVVLDLHDLPNDEIKAAIAEMIIIQAHGYALRGEAPRTLKRLFVFDEAWRVKDSKRLVELAREGRAFGIAIAIGTQFPTDISDDLAGSLETQIFLSNSESSHQAATARKLSMGNNARQLQQIQHTIATLHQLQGFIRNQHYAPYELVEIHPHYRRHADEK